MKLTFSLVFIAFLFCTSNAQITANDSAVTGPGYTQMVFYSLATGSKTIVSDTDWALAVSIRPSLFPNSPLGGTTIRINEVWGVHCFIAPNADALSFNTLDTSGWHSWRGLHDADTLIDMGALNSNRNSNIFDFGWGKYNQTTHNVIGDSIFLIQLADGELKKLRVNGLYYDTAFDIQYANLDNSNSQTAHISKQQYQGKEFVYLNMYSNTILDKEPLSNAWDLEFLQYAATDGSTLPVMPKTGVWVNEGTQVALASGVDVNSDSYSSFTFSAHLNAIGWNWETYDSMYHTYGAQDSLAYFAETNSKALYKIVFTGFGGPSTGVIGFYSKYITSLATGVNDVAEQANFQVYPNPANESIMFFVPTVDKESYLQVLDISGKLVYKQAINEQFTNISTGSFSDGLYVLTLTGVQGTRSAKLVIAH